MDPIAKSIAEALRIEFAPELEELKKSARVVVDAIQARTPASTAAADAASSVAGQLSALLGGRARVQFVADEIRTQTRRFDSYEATAVGVAAASIAALAYFLSASDVAKPLARMISFLLVVPFLTAMFAVAGFSVKDPTGDLLKGAERQPGSVMETTAKNLEQLWWNNDRIVRRRALFVQISLMLLVLFVLVVLGAMVYWS